MHYLITGHTGFKGSWLSLLLQMQGHIVSGVALDPQEKSLFNQAELSNIFENDVRLDIRKRVEIAQVIKKINPEVIIHLAAQPLVRESYKYPVETFDTNVLGTLNILEATKQLKNLKATLVITTDKVYKNHNHLRGYVETDELGGDDPYSASKAAADIATQSWIKSFATSPIAIARAGNVIGGGDWASDRIIPDLVDAFRANTSPAIRNPNAVRPWQHVFDCLNGYLMSIERMLDDGKSEIWNFGPLSDQIFTVQELAENFAHKFGIELDFVSEKELSSSPRETNYLSLDSTKARKLLGWNEKLDFQNALSWTAEWYKNINDHAPRKVCTVQIQSFLEKSK